MEFKDYYQALGVDRTASEDEIRRAYRKLARKYHPDVSKEADAEARMREVNEAYAVLGDKEKREAYDNIGAGVSPGQGFAPPPGWDQGFEFAGRPGGFEEDAEFSDFFSALFGAAARRRGGAARMRGEDHHAAIQIDLEDALRGATRDISLRGIQYDAQGRPEVRERTLSVRIPAGVREGQLIRLAGQGMAGAGGGEAGDLYLEIRFRPHPLYRAEGRDLYLTLPVAPWEAVLGDTVQAPTPGGQVEVTIPPGSRNGRKLRLKGRGIPGNPPGDLYLVLDIAWPPADSDRAREAYKNLAREMPFDPRRNLGAQA